MTRVYRTNFDPRPPYAEACDWDRTVINVRARDARRRAERERSNPQPETKR